MCGHAEARSSCVSECRAETHSHVVDCVFQTQPWYNFRFVFCSTLLMLPFKRGYLCPLLENLDGCWRDCPEAESSRSNDIQAKPLSSHFLSFLFAHPQEWFHERQKPNLAYKDKLHRKGRWREGSEALQLAVWVTPGGTDFRCPSVQPWASQEGSRHWDAEKAISLCLPRIPHT